MNQQRYATVELNSGYVWWVGEAESPEAACQESDKMSMSGEACAFEMVGRLNAPRDSGGGYAVYIVPAGFDVADGQDQDSVEATIKQELVGYYRHIEEAA